MKPATPLPPLVDLHVNGLTVPKSGGMGIDVINFSSPNLTLNEIQRVTAALVHAGTTKFLATLITSAPDVVIRNVSLLAEAMQESWGAPILGIHLEGPFFSLACKGAHPKELVREAADLGLFKSFFDAAQGSIVLTTISPAIRGAALFIEKIKELGVIVSIGHHNATVSQIEEAFDAGASGVTHAGNAWSKELPTNGRKNMEVVAQLCHENAYVMVIPDGVHVDSTFIKYVHRVVEAIKPGRIVWVSDCSPLAHAPEGVYPGFAKGELVTVGPDKDGTVRTFPLTGSYLVLSECLGVLRQMNVVPEANIVAGAFRNPLAFIEPALKRLNRLPDLSTWE